MKKTLLLVGLSVFSILVFGQKTDKFSKSNRISDFKSRIYLSTSKDPLAITKAKTVKAKELAAKELVAHQTLKKSNLKAAVIGKPEIDTTFTYPWDAINQQWDTVPVARMLSFYDGNHNLIHYLAFAWNYDINNWQDSVQFFYKYNSANQAIDVVQQSWQFDGIKSYSWVNVDHDIYEYNDLGQESKFNYQYWDYENSIWIDSWQDEFTYDSNGNNTLILESDWDGSEWYPSLNSINKFDTLNHNTLNLIQVWDYTINDWSDAFQSINGYDTLGNNNSILSQLWDTDSELWDNFMLEIISYNKSNKVDSFLFQLWDPYLLEWTDNERGSYKYDSTGNNTSIIGEDFDPNSGTWTISWENTYDYNAQNKQISSASLYWDSGMGDWYFGAKTKDMKIKTQLAVKQVATATALEVYPNPASDYINIRNGSDIASVQMFDILGNEVLSKNINVSNNFQLNIANLKSGNYFLNIKDSKGTSFTQRIIKR